MAKNIVKEIRSATRRKFTAEEKIRIVLEGFRRDTPIRDLCHSWGWYYLVTVMDDYSRFILAWELKSDMASNSLIDAVQKAVDATGMTDVPLEDRTTLLSDNGPGYISRQFGDYLRLVGIRHILASPYHPQTNGKIERYHRTIKGALRLMPYEMPGALEETIRAFTDYYNYRRYHEGLDDVTPYDIYTGRYLKIIRRRKVT